MPDNPISSVTPQDPPCSHPNQELRRRVVSNGVAHFVMQCQTCGAHLRAVGRDDPIRKALTGLPPDFDDTIAGEYWRLKFARGQERWQAADEARGAETAAWWERYNRYIHSDQWRQKATLRLNFDRSQCQARLTGCLGTATQVHHLTYKHFENEPLFELISVCRRCHDEITSMDRQQIEVTSHAAD